MCEEEGVPPDSTFVVFSEKNKYRPFYEKALDELWENEAAYAAGGYVGLRIGDHHAVQRRQIHDRQRKRTGSEGLGEVP
jgi:hypothetical protein